jgi:hypothetical protein
MNKPILIYIYEKRIIRDSGWLRPGPCVNDVTFHPLVIYTYIVMLFERETSL